MERFETEEEGSAGKHKSYTPIHRIAALQPADADIGLPTGNGKKLSCRQAQLGQATGLAVA